MNILVIGGNGFIGSYLSASLNENGHKVFIFDIIKPHIPFIHCIEQDNPIVSNVLNYELLLKSMKEMDQVVLSVDLLHSFDNMNPSYHELEVNIRSVYNVITAASNCSRLKSVMILNSLSSYGIFESTSNYRVQYAISLSHQLNVTTQVINLGSVYGPGQSINCSCIIPVLIRYKLSKCGTLFYGTSTVGPMYITLVINKLVELLVSPTTEIIDLDGLDKYNIADIIILVNKCLVNTNMDKYTYETSNNTYLIQYTTNDIQDHIDLQSIPLNIGIMKYLIWFKKSLLGTDTIID